MWWARWASDPRSGARLRIDGGCGVMASSYHWIESHGTEHQRDTPTARSSPAYPSGARRDEFGTE